MPYYLAPLWDAKVAAKAQDERRKRESIKTRTTPEEQNASRVPKEIRGKLKKAKAAKGLLQDLEEQVRKFVKSWEEKMKKAEHDELDLIDSEDEEIVFVGRNGQMNDMPPSPDNPKGKGNDQTMDQLQIFDSLATDQGASFGYFPKALFITSFIDIRSGVGSFTTSRPITGFEPGQLLWVTQLDVKHM